jgi:hypothetical protein
MSQKKDIVARLRQKAWVISRPSVLCREEIDHVSLLREAAREIEALRTKLNSQVAA